MKFKLRRFRVVHFTRSADRVAALVWALTHWALCTKKQRLHYIANYSESQPAVRSLVELTVIHARKSPSSFTNFSS